MEVDLKILFQDDSFLAIYKPAGWLVHRTALDAHETLICVQRLRDQIGQLVYPCHRLDKATSGVLLFALNKTALRGANECFAGGRVHKVYHALVRGWVPEAGRLEYALKLEQEGTAKSAESELQAAVTAYQPLEHFEIPEALGRYQTRRYTLLELVPETGRTHQLRRHCAHMRHPIIGDTRHGDGLQNRAFRERFGSYRLFLSAISLGLAHPLTGERLQLESAPGCSFTGPLVQLSCFSVNVSRP